MSLRDKLDDDILDLSLMQLDEVPVQAISTLTKGTTLDLSNNQLRTLPDSFPMLTHLIKLDLSKNQILELPEYFGQLRHLRHLDLYSNQLARLPVSLAHLKSLKWLDLKNNPLVPALQQAAGPCITAADCSMCAKKVVALLQSMQSQLERERQKHIVEEQRADEHRKAQEEMERERLRTEKRAAKERRRDEARAKEIKANPSLKHEMERPKGREPNGTPGRNGRTRDTDSDGSRGWCYSLFMMLVGLAFVTLAMGISMIWIYTGGQMDQRSIERALPLIQKDVETTCLAVGQRVESSYHESVKFAGPYWTAFADKTRVGREEFWRRQRLLSAYVNKNLGPTACAYGRTLKEYLIAFRSYLIDGWLRMKPKLMGLWEQLRPHAQRLGEWILEQVRNASHWVEKNGPILLDWCYQRAVHTYQVVVNTINGIMND